MTACAWSRCTIAPRVHVEDGESYCRPHALAIADQSARTYVIERDMDTCQRCGRQGGNEWAHIVSRGARYIRHDPQNALAFCRGCHVWFTDHPAAFFLWVEERWPHRRERLYEAEARGERRGDSVDLAAVIRGFRDPALTAVELERYESGAWLA
jgi:hypothetical protein